MKKHTWVLLLGISLSLALGMVIGRRTAPGTDPDPSSSPSRSQSSARTKQTGKSNSSNFLSALSPSDLEQELRANAELPLPQQNNALATLLISEWAQRDPLAALAFAQETERNDWVYESLLVYGRDSPDQALQWIEEQVRDYGLKGHFMGAVFRGLVRDDPQAALAKIDELESGGQRNQLLYLTVSEWGQQDIESVFDWMESQSSSPFLAGLYGQVMGQYIEQAPAEASSLISMMEKGADKSNFASQAAFQYATQNPQDALAWVETLEGEAKNFGLMGLMESWAAGPEALAAINFAKAQPTDSGSPELFTMAAMKLSQHDPGTLARELPNFTEDQQTIAAGQLAQVYSARSPEKVKDWITSLDPGAVRDQATRIALNTLRHSDTGTAFELAQTFDDEILRRGELQELLLEWVPTDPEGAVAALNSSTVLSEASKAQLRDFIARQAPNAREYLLPASSE